MHTLPFNRGGISHLSSKRGLQVSATCAGIPCELHLIKQEGHYEAASFGLDSFGIGVTRVSGTTTEPGACA